MYHLHGIESFGKKVISLADQVSAEAQRVKGAVQGAGAGAKSSSIRPYVVPVLGAIAGTALVFILMGGRRRGR